MSENKRYGYWKDSDTAYDTKIKYGQYFRIIDKREMVWLLNEQDKTIKELKKEKDYWKSACAKSDNENVILQKELSNAIEQGYELGNSYNEYLEERKKDMLKHYSDKRRIKKR